jgi:hypothetical protein
LKELSEKGEFDLRIQSVYDAANHLLNLRIEALSLVQLCDGPDSSGVALAYVDTGNAYAQLGLWENAKAHSSCALSMLKVSGINDQHDKIPGLTVFSIAFELFQSSADTTGFATKAILLENFCTNLEVMCLFTAANILKYDPCPFCVVLI